MERRFSTLDHIIAGFDNALRGMSPAPTRPGRPNPADGIEDAALDDEAKRHAAGLMRVNHAGEVAAQGLYQGHAAVARNADIEQQMRAAADEELDHLAWCETRLTELDSGPSQLRPLWYAGAFAIGALSGVVGDKWSLGFIEETEKQVADHLSGHLRKLPESDTRSRAIVRQMRAEEEVHGANASQAGAAPLPEPARALMRACGKVMTRTAYWI